MIKDLLRRKEIDTIGLTIADSIIERFPPELDQPVSNDKQKAKKSVRKFENAVRHGKIQVSTTSEKMRLGIYGKARLCKSIQNKLEESKYTSKTSHVIIEELAKSVGIS